MAKQEFRFEAFFEIESETLLRKAAQRAVEDWGQDCPADTLQECCTLALDLGGYGPNMGLENVELGISVIDSGFEEV